MLLYLDIDGVLIPGPNRHGHTPASHRLDNVLPEGYTEPVKIWLNPEHGPQILELLDATSLEPVWCSSWRADASGLIGSRLGLPAWPHVPLPRLLLTTSHPDGYLWKRDHVAVHAAGAPFAWIDDDFTDVDHAWAEARAAAGHPTLLVQPEHYVGILPEHLHAVRAWAAAGALRRSA
ncbi:HAD domain-containing protein [Streptomyces sp. NPDC026206]|uniref:HAD domain-containing protein n=1 Tax=Streptomyces sp. NPDC026206 TaxID=3157089 RepID=UPI0034083636